MHHWRSDHHIPNLIPSTFLFHQLRFAHTHSTIYLLSFTLFLFLSGCEPISSDFRCALFFPRFVVVVSVVVYSFQESIKLPYDIGLNINSNELASMKKSEEILPSKWREHNKIDSLIQININIHMMCIYMRIESWMELYEDGTEWEYYDTVRYSTGLASFAFW